jgi:RHS repeat-associated protein
MTTNPFHFTGEMRDETGWQYHRARYYAPDLGVFPSLDPLETRNRYAYVNGNPVNFVDPSGLEELAFEQWLGDGGGGGGLAAVVYAAVQSGVLGQALYATAVTAVSVTHADDLYNAGISATGAIESAANDVYHFIFGGSETANILVDQPADIPQDTGDTDWDWPRRLAELCNQTGWCGTALNELLRRLLRRGIEELIDKVLPRVRSDVCPDNSHHIVWPEPIWVSAGYGDYGATSGRFDRPPSIPRILTRVRPVRDQSIVNQYKNDLRNEAAVNALGSNIRVHHKWPLFLGGPDAVDNLVLLTIAEHNDWHYNQLYPQGKTGWMIRDPIGTVYCVS